MMYCTSIETCSSAIRNIYCSYIYIPPPQALHNPQWVCILQPSIGLQPPRVRGYLITHCDAHIRQDSSERMISPSQRPLPDNIQHSQQTNIPAPDGIRTHDRSRRAAVDLRLRPRGYWDRQRLVVRPLIVPPDSTLKNSAYCPSNAMDLTKNSGLFPCVILTDYLCN